MRGSVILSVIIIFFTVSCRSTRHVVNVTPENRAVSDYLEKYAALAVSEMKRTGIPASIKLAQGMVESDHGRSRLAVQANNHFGIKCHSSWTGAVIYHDDDDFNECFRKYNNPNQSFIDHSDFIVRGARYRFLFDLKPTDYKGWARGLKKAGYATNPAYANMLIRKIEANALYYYDSDNVRGFSSSSVSKSVGADRDRPADGRVRTDVRGLRHSAEAVDRIMVRNRVNYIIVGEGDTYESLVNDFSLLSWELERYNEKPVKELIKPGAILYLQPKRRKAEPGVRRHKVSEGETMHRISQIYAIRLKNLYKMNFMEEGEQPEPGREIILR